MGMYERSLLERYEHYEKPVRLTERQLILVRKHLARIGMVVIGGVTPLGAYDSAVVKSEVESLISARLTDTRKRTGYIVGPYALEENDRSVKYYPEGRMVYAPHQLLESTNAVPMCGQCINYEEPRFLRMRDAGSLYLCESCGSTSGCG